MNKSELIAYLEGIDGGLQQPAMLYIYGSAVCILLDEPDRTSLDIDVAGPYSDALVLENLENLRSDLEMWKAENP